MDGEGLSESVKEAGARSSKCDNGSLKKKNVANHNVDDDATPFIIVRPELKIQELFQVWFHSREGRQTIQLELEKIRGENFG